MTKLEELKMAIEAFCISEYGDASKRFTGDSFTLFAVDCGGYDITNDVTMNINGDVITVNVVLNGRVKQFTLKVEE